ncbi:MAG: hypothetical protein JXL80_13395 [Planctomycetes bacterium]|nr:hypothetical protein [Planctomycetota bacterium]
MHRATVTISLLAAGAAALAAAGLLAGGTPLTAAPDDAAAWVALDLSAYMDRDVIQTPNEWIRCRDLVAQDILRGDEDEDMEQNKFEGSYTARDTFGQHGMGAWSHQSYHVRGRYPTFGRDDVAQWQWADHAEGLPPDGRVGKYRLYMDELESPRWPTAAPDGRPALGRNAVQLMRQREDRQLVMTLPASQQRRYRAVNLLFAAEVDYGKNCVRISARYADGSSGQLFEGRLQDFHGPQTFEYDRRDLRVDPPRGQRQVVDYSPIANGYREPAFRSGAYGRATMSEFAEPLPLDAAKKLEAIVLETVYANRFGEPVAADTWAVDFFAASALPARP